MCLRGAGRRRLGGGLIRLGRSEPWRGREGGRERCLPLLATAGNSKAGGGGWEMIKHSGY